MLSHGSDCNKINSISLELHATCWIIHEVNYAPVDLD